MTDYEYIDRRFKSFNRRVTQLEGENMMQVERINQLEKENTLLSNRIERLESIILAMTNGGETSYPNQGDLHTHCYYPLNGARDLVKDIELEQWHSEKQAELHDRDGAVQDPLYRMYGQ